MKHILITGGSGLVGRRLTKIFLQKGHQVSWLSRSGKSIAGVKGYKWDLDKMTIDNGAFDTIDAVVHLAGEGVANGRWTTSRKNKIRASRTVSTKLLCQKISQSGDKVRTFISASGTGFYGIDNGSRLLTEDDRPAADFLSTVTQQWEEEVDKIAAMSVDVTKLRFGIVLSKKGGALEKIIQPIQWNLGATIGNGDQFMSWIHIDDLCYMILHCMENKLTGVYNAVAPNPVTNHQMTKAIARQLGKSIYLPNVPSFVLKLLLGEMSSIVLGSNKVCSKKIENEGFQFQFSDLHHALKDLLR